MIIQAHSLGFVYQMQSIILKIVDMKMSLLFYRFVITFSLKIISSHRNHSFSHLDLRDYTSKNLPLNESTRERQIRDYLINSRLIAFTPSRYNNGHRLVNYDDR